MTTYPFDLNVVDASWKECLERGLAKINPDYLDQLANSEQWIPGPKKIFSAFSMPLVNVNYVLLGESPYPRRESANGYAFWDAAVQELWSENGLSKKVNRATSLRNIMKMLLVAEGLLAKENTGQEPISNIDKTHLVQTNQEFFQQFIKHGFLLLNATPVLQGMSSPQKDARAWSPFLTELLTCLLEKRPHVKFVLFGRIAATLDNFLAHHPQVNVITAEHPYNHTFIQNPDVLDFFKPLRLLKR